MTDPIKQALEVALTALELAQDNLRDHGDNCFLHDEGEYNACFCGKDSLVNHLQSVVERSAAELERAHAEQAQEPTPAAVSGDGPPLLVRLNGLGVEPQARAEQAEPVLVYRGRCVIDCGDNGHHDVELLRMIPKGTKLFTHPAPVQAEPAAQSNQLSGNSGELNLIARAEQAEPVAWLVYAGILDMRPVYPAYNTKELAESAAACIKSNTEVRPLYLAPPAAPAKLEPLTLAEVDAVREKLRGTEYDIYGYTRAIEAAHNAKLGGAG